MPAAPRPELAADLELAAVCTTSPPIAAAVVLAGVLLVELELGDSALIAVGAGPWQSSSGGRVKHTCRQRDDDLIDRRAQRPFPAL